MSRTFQKDQKVFKPYKQNELFLGVTDVGGDKQVVSPGMVPACNPARAGQIFCFSPFWYLDTNANPKDCNCVLSVVLKATNTIDIGKVKIPVIKNTKLTKPGSKLVLCVPSADEPNSKRLKTN